MLSYEIVKLLGQAGSTGLERDLDSGCWVADPPSVADNNCERPLLHLCYKWRELRHYDVGTSSFISNTSVHQYIQVNGQVVCKKT